MAFRDLADAGRRLAERLAYLAGGDAVVLGVPRGGVPVAAEVARRLRAPLDVVGVRKVGAPRQPELAIGAVAEGGVALADPEAARYAGVDRDALPRLVAARRADLHALVTALRGDVPPRDLRGRTAIVVDDGFATGLSDLAAVAAVRARGAARAVAAAPVGSEQAVAMLGAEADECVCALVPRHFGSVGRWYRDFAPVGDEEVRALLAPQAREVRIDAGGAALTGALGVPDGAPGLVVLAHGAGAGDGADAADRYVAAELRRAGLATLLPDLVTEAERHRPGPADDVDLPAARLAGVVAWARAAPALRALQVGLSGAALGAAAALRAAAGDDGIAAVVAWGGRIDLARAALGDVRAPTLLVVGGDDGDGLALHRRLADQLGGPRRLEVVGGAGRLFAEPGALDRVAELAAGWFGRHLTGAGG